MEKQIALDQLNKALLSCRQAGVKLGVTRMYGSTTAEWGILFYSGEVAFDDQRKKFIDKKLIAKPSH